MKVLALLCALIPLQVSAETSLWRVSKNGAELFLGGTIHVLSKSDYPLPVEFTQAYNSAQMLVLETDMKGMETPKVRAMLLEKMQYPKGQSLKNHLKPDTYQALENHLNTLKIPLAALQQFKPSMVMILLTFMELQKLKMSDAGVDNFFNQKALADGKKQGQLESVEKQLSVLENMGNGHEDEMILNTLDELQQLPTVMGDLKKAWRKGDLTKMEETELKPMRNDYPALYQLVLVERNQSWLPKIEAFLQTPETELILVGSLHLAGEDGLLAQLRQRGYTITPF